MSLFTSDHVTFWVTAGVAWFGALSRRRRFCRFRMFAVHPRDLQLLKRLSSIFNMFPDAWELSKSKTKLTLLVVLAVIASEQN